MKARHAAALALATLLGCATANGPVEVMTPRGSDAATPDQAPPERAMLGKRPGSQPVLARTFPTQPPLIPHAAESYDVTLDDNQCLACHDPDSAARKKAPMVAQSHLRHVGGKPELDPSRYACRQCHVQQTDAPPLVGTDFRSVQAAPRAAQ